MRLPLGVVPVVRSDSEHLSESAFEVESVCGKALFELLFREGVASPRVITH